VGLDKNGKVKAGVDPLTPKSEQRSLADELQKVDRRGTDRTVPLIRPVLAIPDKPSHTKLQANLFVHSSMEMHAPAPSSRH
jgi:hypothetical protein